MKEGVELFERLERFEQKIITLPKSMTEEEKQVAAANENFYRAFESLDLAKMEGVWLRENYIRCVHPGWNLLSGWEAVMESWKRIFQNTLGIRFVLTEVSIKVEAGLAFVTLYENITSDVGGGTAGFVVLTTNIFERRGNEWRMVHHHGSPVAQPPPRRSNPSTVH
jgi:ketosteroid isomerase-like protein